MKLLPIVLSTRKEFGQLFHASKSPNVRAKLWIRTIIHPYFDHVNTRINIHFNLVKLIDKNHANTMRV